MERWFTFPDIMEEQVSQYWIVCLKWYNSFRLVHEFSMIMENLNKICYISSDSAQGTAYCWQWLSTWAGT